MWLSIFSPLFCIFRLFDNIKLLVLYTTVPYLIVDERGQIHCDVCIMSTDIIRVKQSINPVCNIEIKHPSNHMYRGLYKKFQTLQCSHCIYPSLIILLHSTMNTDLTCSNKNNMSELN